LLDINYHTEMFTNALKLISGDAMSSVFSNGVEFALWETVCLYSTMSNTKTTLSYIIISNF